MAPVRLAGRDGTYEQLGNGGSRRTGSQVDPLNPEPEDPAADMEMTTKEAATYLSGPVGYTLSDKFVRGLTYVSRGLAVEKRGNRLVYRKSDRTPSSWRMAPIRRCGSRAYGPRRPGRCEPLPPLP